jgi:hypothetical protein
MVYDTLICYHIKDEVLLTRLGQVKLEEMKSSTGVTTTYLVNTEAPRVYIDTEVSGKSKIHLEMLV